MTTSSRAAGTPDDGPRRSDREPAGEHGDRGRDGREHGREHGRETVTRERAVEVVDGKTSAAATFGLIFGLSALICVLTVLLSPAGLVLGIIGIVVAIFGIVMASRPGVTGGAVAITGLVMSVLAVLLSIAIAAGLTFFLNDDAAVQRLENKVSDLRSEAPSDVNVPQP